MGRGRPDQPLVPGWVVVSAAVATPPTHKQNPGTARERAKRAKAHAQHRAHKQGRKTKPPSAAAQRYAQTWVLFTTASTVAQAVAEYAQRMPIEETFRDWHSGWGVRAAVVALPTEAMVDRLIGVVCLTYSLQCTGPAAECGPAGAAAPGAMDSHRSGQLVLVWATAVQRPWLRLECVVGGPMGNPEQTTSTGRARTRARPDAGRGRLIQR